MRPFNNNDEILSPMDRKALLYRVGQVRLWLSREENKALGPVTLIRQAGSAGFNDNFGLYKDEPIWLVEVMTTGEEKEVGINSLGPKLNEMEVIAWAAKQG